MNLLSIHTKQDDGTHKLDPNKIVELLIKVVAVIAGVMALKASNQSQKQQEFLKYQFTPTYIDQVEKGNAPNQRSKK